MVNLTDGGNVGFSVLAVLFTTALGGPSAFPAPTDCIEGGK